MYKSVYLYLASVIFSEKAFWQINFTDNLRPFNIPDYHLLECYRKELVGLEAAKEIQNAIKTTLDIIVYDSNKEGYEVLYSEVGYSYEIPLSIMEDIFDFWFEIFCDKAVWNKQIGILKFRKKLKNPNYFVCSAFKGKTYKFFIELERLLSYRPIKHKRTVNLYNKYMW